MTPDELPSDIAFRMFLATCDPDKVKREKRRPPSAAERRIIADVRARHKASMAA